MNQRQKCKKLAEQIKANTVKAGDFQTIIDNLPPGQVKNLLKDEVCGPILEKYGVTGK